MIALEQYVIVYDIVNDKRRSRIFKLLKEFATPVQDSVFEAVLSKSNVVRLEHQLVSLIHKEEDSIIIYKQCGYCKEKINRLGVSKMVYGEEDIIL